SSRRRHTRFSRDWSSDVCSSDLLAQVAISQLRARNRAYSSQDMFAASQAGMADLDVQRVALEVEYRSYQSLLDELTTNSGRSLEIGRASCREGCRPGGQQMTET